MSDSLNETRVKIERVKQGFHQISLASPTFCNCASWVFVLLIFCISKRVTSVKRKLDNNYTQE